MTRIHRASALPTRRVLLKSVGEYYVGEQATIKAHTRNGCHLFLKQNRWGHFYFDVLPRINRKAIGGTQTQQLT